MEHPASHAPGSIPLSPTFTNSISGIMTAATTETVGSTAIASTYITSTPNNREELQLLQSNRPPPPSPYKFDGSHVGSLNVTVAASIFAPGQMMGMAMQQQEFNRQMRIAI